MDVKALIDERLKLYEENKALLDSSPQGLSAEQQAQLDARFKRIDEIRKQVDNKVLLDAEERALAESRGRKTETTTTDTRSASEGPSVEDLDDAFRGWALGRGRATEGMLSAAQKVGLPVDGKEIELHYRVRPDEEGRQRPELRSLTCSGREVNLRALSLTSAEGGSTVPNELIRRTYEVEKWYGNVRGVSEVVQTESGATLPWPTVDDTSNTGEIIAEAGAVTVTADPTFGIRNLGAFKFSSKGIYVSVELLQDTAMDLPRYLGGMLGTRIGRIQNNKFTVGTGTGEPDGLVVRSALGKTAASTTVIAFDEIVDLIHSVDPAYRPRAGFMFHDGIAQHVRKLKDGNGRYLWEMSVQIGMPDRLLGYPVTINNDMQATVATGTKTMLFGAFGNYLVRDAGPLILLRSDDLRLLNHQAVFVGFQRSDGDLIDTTSVKHLIQA